MKRGDIFFKETYYDCSNIEIQGQNFLNQLDPYQRKRKISLKSKHIALLILDMQDFFLKPSSHAYIPSAKPVLEKLQKLKEKFQEHNLFILQTRHLNTKKNAGQMIHWWKDLLVETNPLSFLVEELQDKTTLIIHKAQYDSFYGTNLEEILRSKNIDQLIVTGVMTHLCLESTIRSAFIRDFEVFCPIDGTATYNQTFHLASFTNLAHGFAQPILMKDLFKWLEE